MLDELIPDRPARINDETGHGCLKSGIMESKRKERCCMDEKIAKLKSWIDECSRIVFFGGAGVSTESGVPDFRSVDGLYAGDHPEPFLFHAEA